MRQMLNFGHNAHCSQSARASRIYFQCFLMFQVKISSLGDVIDTRLLTWGQGEIRDSLMLIKKLRNLVRVEVGPTSRTSVLLPLSLRKLKENHDLIPWRQSEKNGRWKCGVGFGGNIQLCIVRIGEEIDNVFKEKRSSMSKVNSRSPKIEPWGTPAETGNELGVCINENQVRDVCETATMPHSQQGSYCSDIVVSVQPIDNILWFKICLWTLFHSNAYFIAYELNTGWPSQFSITIKLSAMWSVPFGFAWFLWCEVRQIIAEQHD